MRHLCLGAELVGANGKDLDCAGLLLGELIFTARHVAHEGGQRGELFFTVQKFDMADAGDGAGSGLGLYIVTYILKRMDGELKLRNHADGLDAVVTFELADAPGENFR